MIFLSAGHHNGDPGAIGHNKLKEADLTKIQRDLTLKELERKNVDYITDLDSETLGQYLSRIKTGTGSVVLEYHFNAFNGRATGVEGLVGDDADSNDKAFMKEITDSTANILKLTNRGVKFEKASARGRLAIMRELGIVGLLEICFIDNKKDVESWENNKEKLAVAHAVILEKYEKLP